MKLPPEWFMRLEVFCKKRWEEQNREGVKAPLDIYQFIGVARRTIENAIRAREMSQRSFATITVAIGCDSIEHLKAILSGTPSSGAKLAAPPEKITTDVPSEAESSTVHKKMLRAQELVRAGESKAAQGLMEEALATARTAKQAEAIVECVVGIVLTSPRRSHPANRRELVAEAEQAVQSVTDPALKVLFLRAKARVCHDSRDIAGEEATLREALALCETQTDDKKRNLASQACILRSVLVHTLCHAKRLDEAKPLLADCESYAHANPEDEDGELLRAALQAGIHLEAAADNEEGAIARIAEFEAAAKTSRRADGMGGDLTKAANNLSHDGAHKAALAAAQAAVRLSRRVEGERGQRFLAGALYTEASVLARSRIDDELALRKAEALLNLCNHPDDAVIKQATQQLIGELRRVSGDSQTAVDLARTALASITGEPEAIAFAKSSLARALNDNGQTDEALKEVRESLELLRSVNAPTGAFTEVLSQVSNYASQLGDEVVLQTALQQLKSLPDSPEEIKAEKARARACADANLKLRGRFLDLMAAHPPSSTSDPQKFESLASANAVVTKPMIDLWNESKGSADTAAGLYDFWGRGSFARILHNTRTFPESFNVTVEARTCDDVKKAVRLWGLYADLLLVVWKGPTESCMTIVPIHEGYGDEDEAGGWGYMIAMGSVLKYKDSKRRWYPAMGQASLLPRDVAVFLANEARPFVQAGRLIVVPAVGAGCINPGHGPFEQLLAESANAIPCIRWKGVEGISIGLVPYSPNAPFEVLAEIAESESVTLRKLRLLLLRRTRELNLDGTATRHAKELSLEIDDALRDLQDKHQIAARKNAFTSVDEPLHGAVAQFKQDGHRLGSVVPQSPFAPLLVLQTLGYGWRVEGTAIPKLPLRFEPEKGDVIGTWLAPPTGGWVIPTVKVAE
ncbi:MAG TPA: hypothetical protein VHE81_17405 [Lacipirellulaceae bacterium]|nr:hypothetical protein [Lacipirellulaceae bacterium]